MTRAEALRRIRGTRSLREFAHLLVRHGLEPGQLSRQRLSAVEKGETDLPPELWRQVAAALRAAGEPPETVAALMPAPRPVIDPVPSSDPALRRRQWIRLLDSLPGNRWWQRPTTVVARVLGEHWVQRYHGLVARFGIDPEQQRQEVRRRLASTATWTPSANDRVAVDGDESTRRIRLDSGDLFVFAVRLHNTGDVAWRDRMLYRLGAPVSSSLPFTPALVPVPDTDPGGSATALLPGRAQWFPNLAVLSFAMVFADCAPCVPGVVRCYVDTRQPDHFDRTLHLPDTFGR